MKLTILALAALLSIPAIAEAYTTTQCTTFGGGGTSTTQCTTWGGVLRCSSW